MITVLELQHWGVNSLTISFLMSVVLTIVSGWGLVLLGLCGGRFNLGADATTEIWRKRSAAGLDVRLIGTILLGNAVWFIYGLAISDWVLITINAGALIIFGTVMFLWQRYQVKPRTDYAN